MVTVTFLEHLGLENGLNVINVQLMFIADAAVVICHIIYILWAVLALHGWKNTVVTSLALFASCFEEGKSNLL